MLKQIAKRGAQSFAARFGPHTRKHSHPRLVIITYHRILPENDIRLMYEEPGMTVTPTTFKNNLEVLAEYFEFISLSDWIDRKQQGRPLPGMACAITFDDGWSDNYEFAYPILEKEHIPATIFVVSNMIGSRKLFWPERMARIVFAISEQRSKHWNKPELAWLRKLKDETISDDSPPTREQITRIIALAKENTDQENHRRLDVIEQTLDLHIQPENASLLDWVQLKEMTNNGLIELGSHTCNHTRLNTKTPGNIIQNEIVSSKNEIEKQTGQSVKTFCFPNGDYSEEALALVKQNYSGAVTTNSGWNSDNSNAHLLCRIGVHEDIAKDETSFLARISGWV